MVQEPQRRIEFLVEGETLDEEQTIYVILYADTAAQAKRLFETNFPKHVAVCVWVRAFTGDGTDYVPKPSGVQSWNEQ